MNKNKKGFTLVEMLAAIGILLLITILTYPSFNKLNKKTEEKFDYSTKTIVENAAKDINRKNKAPQSLPPAIWLNTFGSVINTSPGPAPGSTPNAKHAGMMINPAINATNVSRIRILTLSPASVHSLPM